jgi:hypothetical protein
VQSLKRRFNVYLEGAVATGKTTVFFFLKRNQKSIFICYIYVVGVYEKETE